MSIVNSDKPPTVKDTNIQMLTLGNQKKIEVVVVRS